MMACNHVCKMIESSPNKWGQTGLCYGTTLFSMMFSAMLMNAFLDSDTGFPIRYRFDGNIFNLRRLQAKIKVQTDVLDELLNTDDMDNNASSEAKMQRAMDQVSQSCDNYDLIISTKKTEVVHQPAAGYPYNGPTITVNGQKLKVVDKFAYLGSTLSRAVYIDDEVTARIAQAIVSFGRLRANIWERNGTKLDTKLKVFKAVVLPTLLYACETCTVYIPSVMQRDLTMSYIAVKLLKSSCKTRFQKRRS